MLSISGKSDGHHPSRRNAMTKQVLYRDIPLMFGPLITRSPIHGKSCFFSNSCFLVGTNCRQILCDGHILHIACFVDADRGNHLDLFPSLDHPAHCTLSSHRSSSVKLSFRPVVSWVLFTSTPAFQPVPACTKVITRTSITPARNKRLSAST